MEIAYDLMTTFWDSVQFGFVLIFIFLAAFGGTSGLGIILGACERDNEQLVIQQRASIKMTGHLHLGT